MPQDRMRWIGRRHLRAMFLDRRHDRFVQRGNLGLGTVEQDPACLGPSTQGLAKR